MNGAIAIITARGGSKRIPKKNIKEFCGKPIIAYSIEAAFASKIFTEVMVSTDDPEIADIAIQYGAKVPFLRSNETSDDFSTTRDVLDEVIATYKTKLKRRFDYVCCIYPTAPFVSAKKLREAYDMLKDCKTDQVIPVVQFSFPPQRGFIIDSAEPYGINGLKINVNGHRILSLFIMMPDNSISLMLKYFTSKNKRLNYQ